MTDEDVNPKKVLKRGVS